MIKLSKIPGWPRCRILAGNDATETLILVTQNMLLLLTFLLTLLYIIIPAPAVAQLGASRNTEIVIINPRTYSVKLDLVTDRDEQTSALVASYSAIFSTLLERYWLEHSTLPCSFTSSSGVFPNIRVIFANKTFQALSPEDIEICVTALFSIITNADFTVIEVTAAIRKLKEEIEIEALSAHSYLSLRMLKAMRYAVTRLHRADSPISLIHQINSSNLDRVAPTAVLNWISVMRARLRELFSRFSSLNSREIAVRELIRDSEGWAAYVNLPSIDVIHLNMEHDIPGPITHFLMQRISASPASYTQSALQKLCAKSINLSDQHTQLEGIINGKLVCIAKAVAGVELWLVVFLEPTPFADDPKIFEHLGKLQHRLANIDANTSVMVEQIYLVTP